MLTYSFDLSVSIVVPTMFPSGTSNRYRRLAHSLRQRGELTIRQSACWHLDPRKPQEPTRSCGGIRQYAVVPRVNGCHPVS